MTPRRAYFFVVLTIVGVVYTLQTAILPSTTTTTTTITKELPNKTQQQLTPIVVEEPASDPTQHYPQLLSSLPFYDSQATHCGWGYLKSKQIQPTVTWVGKNSRGGMTVRVTVTFPRSEDIVPVEFNGRMVGKDTMLGAVVILGPKEHNDNNMVTYDIVFPPPPPPPSSYTLDVLLTWVGDKFIGSKWELPNRNDNPPFAEMKRKCLALTLADKAVCSVYGAVVYQGKIDIEQPATIHPNERICTSQEALYENGGWHRMLPDDVRHTKFLADPVGLNTFDGSNWAWQPLRCRMTYFTPTTALACLSSSQNNFKRILLVGDSMLVEQFNMLREFFAHRRTREGNGKYKNLRWMSFDTLDGVTVQFIRGYTTSGGHSVIASAQTLASYIQSYNPDVLLGNFAVLHWQQNMEPVHKWESQLRALCKLLRKSPKPLATKHAFYLGPTLIQLGRTQGLHPSRTRAFSKTARDVLGDDSCGFKFVDVHNVSAPRRESSFDGQHWACYHTYGGVSHTITQMFLNVLCHTTI